MNIKTVECYECGKCKKIFTKKEFAEKCCEPRYCSDCGVEVKNYRIRCEPCSLKKRFAEAEKITDWDGAVYWEGRGYNEGYFWTVDDLYEYCDNEEIEVPEWVFVCESDKHQLDIESSLENMLSDAYEDAAEDLVDEKELIDFVEQWNQKQTVTSYYPDYKKVLLLKEV